MGDVICLSSDDDFEIPVPKVSRIVPKNEAGENESGIGTIVNSKKKLSGPISQKHPVTGTKKVRTSKEIGGTVNRQLGQTSKGNNKINNKNNNPDTKEKNVQGAQPKISESFLSTENNPKQVVKIAADKSVNETSKETGVWRTKKHKLDSATTKQSSPKKRKISENPMSVERSESPEIIEIIDTKKSEKEGFNGTTSSSTPKRDTIRELKKPGPLSMKKIATKDSAASKSLNSSTSEDDSTVKIELNGSSKTVSGSSLPNAQPAIRRITPVSLRAIEPNSPKLKSNNTEKDKSKDTSKDFEPIAGCSKTPDDHTNTTHERGTENSCSVESAGSSEEKRIVAMPQLVIKEKRPLSPETPDSFAMFLSACMSAERSDTMTKVVARLKRCHEKMNPDYAKSEAFSRLIGNARRQIATTGFPFMHIEVVLVEMKARRARHTSMSTSTSTERNEQLPNGQDDELIHENDENGAKEDRDEERRTRRKFKMIQAALEKCTKKIEKLETAEVDFDDDNNSHYIQLERFKAKAVQLYGKLCELTGEHADAGRAYLRPKHFRVTQIPTIDSAINSFINSKITLNRKKLLKGQSCVDALIFPDYVDILECIEKVNDDENLQLDRRRQQKMAEEAFTKLGQELQKARQKDYWDTFSSVLESGQDPATIDTELTDKLQQNQAIAEQQMKDVFAKYVTMQEERGNNASSTSDDEENEEGTDDEAGGSPKTPTPPGSPEISDRVGENEAEDREKMNGTSNDLEATEVEANSLDSATNNPAIDEPLQVEGIVEEKSAEEKSDENPVMESNAGYFSKENNAKNSKKVENAEKSKEDNNARISKEDKNSIDSKEDENVKISMEYRKAENSKEDENAKVSTEDEHAEKSKEGKTEECPLTTEEEAVEPPKMFRIRSFAKPSPCWANSQEDEPKSNRTETIDLIDEDDTQSNDESTRKEAIQLVEKFNRSSNLANVVTIKLPAKTDGTPHEPRIVNSNIPYNIVSSGGRTIIIQPRSDGQKVQVQLAPNQRVLNKPGTAQVNKVQNNQKTLTSGGATSYSQVPVLRGCQVKRVNKASATIIPPAKTASPRVIDLKKNLTSGGVSSSSQVPVLRDCQVKRVNGAPAQIVPTAIAKSPRILGLKNARIIKLPSGAVTAPKIGNSAPMPQQQRPPVYAVVDSRQNNNNNSTKNNTNNNRVEGGKAIETVTSSVSKSL